MDNNKLSYFLAKYRGMADSDLVEIRACLTELADEADVAFRQIAQERGLSIHQDQPRMMTEVERQEEARRSSKLWNSSLSKQVQTQFSFLAPIFIVSFAGPQGLKLGALWMLLLGAPLLFFANWMGKGFTRSVCADEEKTLDEKQRNLRNTSYLLWPGLFLAAFLGVLLASLIRGH